MALVAVKFWPEPEDPLMAENAADQMMLPGMESGEAEKQLSSQPILNVENEPDTGLAFMKAEETDPNEIRRMSGRIEAPANPKTVTLTPNDIEKFNSLETGAPAKLRGKLSKVRLSSTGKSLYFEFSNPAGAEQIRGVSYKKLLKGDYDPMKFKHLEGQEVVISGKTKREGTKKPWLVQFSKIKDVE